MGDLIKLYSLSAIEPLISVSFLLFVSLSMRIFLQLVGQRWIVTVSHTTTLVLLPILTYVITNVISGNIALSLGMVGALSIVRFRHPVRSPLELSVYFGAITMGIAASVSLKWLIFLSGSVFFAALILVSLQKLSSHFFNQPFFLSSFSEGNVLSTLEVSASTHLVPLEESDKLTVKKVSDGNIYYILASSDFKELWNIQKQISSMTEVISFQLNK